MSREKSVASASPAVPADYWRGRPVLITGGLGFIGSTLAHRLIAAGSEVAIVDNLAPDHVGNLLNLEELRDRARVETFSSGDLDRMEPVVHGRKTVFNLAGKSAHLESMHDPLADMRVNCEAQIQLLEACRRFAPDAKVVFTSTRQVYGRPKYLPVDEAHPPEPTDINGVNKLAGEQYHILYHRFHGLKTCVLRLTNTYGPRMRVKDAAQTFLGVWIRRVVEGESFDVWGGEQKRDFTYGEDCAEALMVAAASPATDGQVFNLGGGPPVTLKELAEMVVSAAGGGRFEIKTFPAERKKIDIGDYFSDDRLFRRTVGWTDKMPLAKGLERTIEFYRRNLSRYV